MTYQTGQNRQLPQILAILAGSLSILNNGMLYAWTSPSIPKLLSLNRVSIEEASYFTVFPPLAMLMIAPLFPLFIDKFGRKRCLLVMVLPHLLSWILIGLAVNLWMLYAARLLTGLADAATLTVFPYYLGEISEPSVRGTWGNTLSISLVAGKVVVNVIGSYTSIETTAWICLCCPILYGILSIFLPESPYFLLMVGKHDKAKEALKSLRWRDDVDEELQAMQNAVTRQISESGTMMDLFRIKSNRRALCICVGLRLGQLCSGFVAFDTYTQYIFELSDLQFSEKIAAIIFSGVSLLSFCVSSLFVDRIGRRPLAFFSSLGSGIVLTIVSIYFCLLHFTSLDLSNFNWLPFAGLVGFIVVFSPGLGLLPSLVTTELLSASIKAKAGSVIIVNHALAYLIVPKLFQVLSYNFGLYAPFLLFTFCTYLTFFFSYVYVIETKGKTLEEVQQVLKGETTKS